MDELLQQGITAYKTGNRDEARKIFITVVKQYPENERAWGWMYSVASNDKEREYCLKQMLRINPNNEKASQLLNQLLAPPFASNLPPAAAPPSLKQVNSSNIVPKKSSNNTWLISLIALSIIVICVVVLGGGYIIYNLNRSIPNAILPIVNPKMPNDLKIQMSKVLEEGATLTAMTEQGVNFLNFGEQLAKTRGAYNLALSLWPEDFAPDAKTNFDNAFQGWDLTLYLWNAKIDRLDNPVEPDINKYEEFVAYSGNQLIFDVHPSDFLVENYRGKKYLPFDENISILLSTASDYFQTGHTLIQQEMK